MCVNSMSHKPLGPTQREREEGKKPELTAEVPVLTSSSFTLSLQSDFDIQMLLFFGYMVTQLGLKCSNRFYLFI